MAGIMFGYLDVFSHFLHPWMLVPLDDLINFLYEFLSNCMLGGDI